MRLRTTLLTGVLYLFGVFAALVAIYAANALLDSQDVSILRVQYLLLGLAAVTLGLIIPLRWWLESLSRDLFFARRHLETVQNRLAIREEDATLLTRINELTEKFSETRNLEAVLHQAVST